MYKYTISGKELHLLGDDFEDPTLSEYTPPESGFELLERQDRQIFIKALGLGNFSIPILFKSVYRNTLYTNIFINHRLPQKSL